MKVFTLPKLLRTQLKKNRLNHAYLLFGPGRKFITAKKFALSIFSHFHVELNREMNYLLLEKKPGFTQIQIEQIRELRKRLSLRSDGPRVILIRKAELLNINAANALLKTLEEPAKNTFFILTTTQIKAVISTIISRCQRIYLTPTRQDYQNLGRGKWTTKFLEGDLIDRFKLTAEVAKVKGGGKKLIDGLELALREEMLGEEKLKKKKMIAAEIKIIAVSRLLLKKNISVKLILEDLSLRIKRRKHGQLYSRLYPRQ